jgi:hypothetical protein
MWRSLGEQFRQFAQIDAISPFEGKLAHSVLLNMVITAETDRPSVRRFQSSAAIGVPPNMGTLDRTLKTTGNTAVMPAHPGAVSRTVAAARLARPLPLKPVREL